MNQRAVRQRVLAHTFRPLGVALVLLAAACGEGPTPPPDDLLIAGALLADADGTVHAHSHADHWHGLLEVPRDGQLELTVYMLSRVSGTSEPPPREHWFTLQDEPDYSIQVTLNPDDVAEWEGERYHARLRARRSASTIARFSVRHRGRTEAVYEAPSLLVLVDE